MAKAGLEAIYLSGCRSRRRQPGRPHLLGPEPVPGQQRPRARPPINNACLGRRWPRVEGEERSCLLPIVADAEAGFEGPLNAYELTAALIEAGAAGIHFEDQLASEKKCGHLGGKVLVPTGQFIRTLQAARLAADVAGVPTILVAWTDALAATLLTSDVDERDRAFLTGERTAEGYFRVRPARRPRSPGPSPTPPTPICCGARPPTSTWTRPAARRGRPRPVPGQAAGLQLLAQLNWRRALDEQTIARFQKELAAMGYWFQFITLAGFHSLNAAMFEPAAGYAAEGMPAYVRLQQHEPALEPAGYTATRHQRGRHGRVRPGRPGRRRRSGLHPGPGRLHRAPCSSEGPDAELPHSDYGIRRVQNRQFGIRCPTDRSNGGDDDVRRWRHDVSLGHRAPIASGPWLPSWPRSSPWRAAPRPWLPPPSRVSQRRPGRQGQGAPGQTRRAARRGRAAGRAAERHRGQPRPPRVSLRRLQARQKAAQAEPDTAQAQLDEQARATYMQGPSWLLGEPVGGAASPPDALRRLPMQRAASRARAAVVTEGPGPQGRGRQPQRAGRGRPRRGRPRPPAPGRRAGARSSTSSSSSRALPGQDRRAARRLPGGRAVPGRGVEAGRLGRLHVRRRHGPVLACRPVARAAVRPWPSWATPTSGAPPGPTGSTARG